MCAYEIPSDCWEKYDFLPHPVSGSALYKTMHRIEIMYELGHESKQSA